MKVIVFGGGSGRRLWPISRQNTPKQFEPIIQGKSTMQLAVERVSGVYGSQSVFISTNQKYLDILHKQLPDIPPGQFIGEPTRRDLAAAVGLAMLHVNHFYGSNEPVAIVWGDNYITDKRTFQSLLATGEQLLGENGTEIVFIGETARFANNNLGWIGLGDELGRVNGVPFFRYDSWLYRPDQDECLRMYESGDYVWNTGYFITRPGFILQAYRDYQPVMWKLLKQIGNVIGESEYDEILERNYPKIEVASFDDAIVQKIELDRAVVLHGPLGWSDPGTLYALKESIDPREDANVEKGLIKSLEASDCLLYNYEENKLVAAVGLEGMIVVNTEDALLVVHKDKIPLVKKLVNEFEGTELEKYS